MPIDRNAVQRAAARVALAVEVVLERLEEENRRGPRPSRSPATPGRDGARVRIRERLDRRTGALLLHAAEARGIGIREEVRRNLAALRKEARGLRADLAEIVGGAPGSRLGSAGVEGLQEVERLLEELDRGVG